MPSVPIRIDNRIPEPAGELIHDRNYSIKAYKEAEDRLRLRGQVHDEKPAGLYVTDDPDPLSVHLMVVDLVIAFPSLEILEAEVVMDVTPHTGCSTIEPTYSQLVGLSIARGFSRKVKDLFGGPRGCTHVGALLQAMAPVAVQSMWSMRAKSDAILPEADTPEQRAKRLSFNKNTCHVWDEDGEQWSSVMGGEALEVPVWAHDRLVSLGRDPEEWRKVGG